MVRPDERLWPVTSSGPPPDHGRMWCVRLDDLRRLDVPAGAAPPRTWARLSVTGRHLAAWSAHIRESVLVFGATPERSHSHEDHALSERQGL
jgi:hypothetical protein